ncbi:MAG TPA: transglycosylase domain-containing protein [Candidatus Limnocylindrales bacterium]|nr:transglycosylase domain-containing protein [Candidatus Limnocylindrales bacterium]
MQRASRIRSASGRRTASRIASSHAGLARGGYGRRRRGGRSRLITAIVALFSVVLIGTLVTVALAGVAGVATVAVLSQDLPDPAQLEQLHFDQPTIVYDRTGKVELGRFQRVQRRVVDYDQIPRLVLDSATSAEDRTFWTNSGFDPAQIVSAVVEGAGGGPQRGASTITQQLVRARLLPQDVVSGDQYVRKAKELIQATRLTDAFPGEPGKERIITAYLNEIYYGHDAYGVAAAANVYFGVTNLAKLTVSQAALLAGLPKSPSAYDPYKYAKADAKGRLVVDPSSPPVVRRNYVLDGLRSARWTHLTPAQITAAEREPVILRGDEPLTYQAPHFMWQVRDQLVHILGSADKVETGGYRVITTLDMTGQRLAEKWVTAAAIAPNLSAKKRTALLSQLKIKASDRRWISRLRGKDVHNAALVAVDYRTGDVLAYVGSAGYYEDGLASAKFNPKFDVLSTGYRQPGSAWKPVLYATAFETHALTPGSVLLDITTKFGRKLDGTDWAPRDADLLDRGPVRVRQALQYSLNIPAIRALERTGNAAVAEQAQKMGITFKGGATTYERAGLAGAIGTVEVRPIDLVSAFGTIADGGVRVPPRMILEIDGPDGKAVYKAPDPSKVAKQALSPQAAFLVTDILDGNTDPRQNPIWSAVLELHNGPHASRRPAAVKTGTTNDTRDLATYGFLGRNEDASAPSIAVGVWMGNSDHSQPRAPANEAVISLQGPAPLWHAFVRDYSAKKPVGTFDRPSGVVQATIDRYSGGAPGRWTRGTVREWFIKGTEPGSAHAVDPPGLLYQNGCVNVVQAELGPSEWDADVADWQHRAGRGTGVSGKYDTRTAYFWGQSSWGGPICGARPKARPAPQGDSHPKHHPKPKPSPPNPEPTPKPKPTPKPGGGKPSPSPKPGAPTPSPGGDTTGAAALSGGMAVGLVVVPLAPLVASQLRRRMRRARRRASRRGRLGEGVSGRTRTRTP